MSESSCHSNTNLFPARVIALLGRHGSDRGEDHSEPGRARSINELLVSADLLEAPGSTPISPDHRSADEVVLVDHRF